MASTKASSPDKQAAAADAPDSASSHQAEAGVPTLLPNPDVRPKVPQTTGSSKSKKKKKKKGRAEGEPGSPSPTKGAPSLSATEDCEEGEDYQDHPPEEGSYDGEAVDLAHRFCKTVLTQAATVENPEPMDGYPTLGLTDEKRKLAQKKLFPTLINLEYMELVQLMRQLWVEEERDYQLMVLQLLKHATVTIMRSSGHKDLFYLLRFFVNTKPSKNTVDELATKHLTTLAYLEPGETWPQMDKWVKPKAGPWAQRAALLHQHGLGDFTDIDRLFRYIKEFFLVIPPENADILEDAVEEALRRFSKTFRVDMTPSGAEHVVHFVNDNKHVMSEGLKQRLTKLSAALEPLIIEAQLKTQVDSVAEGGEGGDQQNTSV